MKIVASSPTELIIRDSAMTLRVVGAFVVVLGAFAIAMGFTHDPERVGVVPVVLGSLIAFGGVALVALPYRKTFAFSRAERVFIIAKQRFGRVERETFPLDQIADVDLEESRSRDDGTTYRVSMTLVDQRRIPWVSYYTSGYASKRAVVKVVREFLRLEPSPALGSDAPTAQAERDARRGRVGLLIAAAFCSVFLVFGVTMLAKEQRRLSVYQPVPATVLSTRVEEHSDSDGSTYEPVVVYRYRVNDREYTASRVTPLKESRGGRWASRVTARYEVGGTYTAFYDPSNPAEAYLMKTRSVIPWAFVGISVIALVMILGGIKGSYDLKGAS